MNALRLLPLFPLFFTLPAPAQEDYPPHPDAVPNPAVPKGELVKFTFDQSKIFPGTTREVTVYVPRQYEGSKPACVYVNQDGLQWKADVVFDNLIAKGDMPVTIGVFVTPGRVPAPHEGAMDRFNRSYEYDGLGDGYARFLLEELLPAVEQKTTGDGRRIVLSQKGADRAIGGSSSGAVCAWTAAWERPDAFTRVFSAIGTYVGLRGANDYPTLVRKHEPKPLRVFLQDGSNDLNIYAGDWWMVNQEMQRALAWAGYEVRHVWGEGGHNGKHGTAVFPDAMRWLWEGWPEAPKNHGTKNAMLNEVLVPGAGWELVGEGYQFTEGPAANARGEVVFNDVGAGRTYKIGPDGKPALWIPDTLGGDGQAFGPDGRLYAPAAKPRQILAWGPDGKALPLAGGWRGNDLTVRADGTIYCTEPAWEGTGPSKIWMVPPQGEPKVVDTGLKFANGLALSPDQTLLYVADSRSKWVYSYQVQPDGTLRHKQRFFHLHEPDTAEDAGPDGIEVDRLGRVYVATRLGIQICDQPGRVNCILPTPNGKVSNLCFGGEKFDILYATCGDKVYRRPLKVAGAPSFLPPVKPPKPGL
jgi:sugar lactone lactonase YvrE/enterochelin esterase-like enzyme